MPTQPAGSIWQMGGEEDEENGKERSYATVETDPTGRYTRVRALAPARPRSNPPRCGLLSRAPC